MNNLRRKLLLFRYDRRKFLELVLKLCWAREKLKNVIPICEKNATLKLMLQ